MYIVYFKSPYGENKYEKDSKYKDIKMAENCANWYRKSGCKSFIIDEQVIDLLQDCPSWLFD